MTLIDCLLIRQPYASLIAFGKKRWEFRQYSTKKTGLIGIAASKGPPLRTLNVELNKIAPSFPRGVVLATANLTSSFYVTADDLNANKTEPIMVNLHGHLAKTYDQPIGEPIQDVDNAAKQKGWESFAWLLEDINILETPKQYVTSFKSTWGKSEI